MRVFLVLAAFCLFLGTATGLAQSPPARASAEDGARWLRLRSTFGGFDILVPRPLLHRSDSFPKGKLAERVLDVTEDGISYSVAYAAFPEPVKRSEAEFAEIVDRNQRRDFESPTWAVVEGKRIALNGFFGRETRLRSFDGETVVILRCFMSKTHLYYFGVLAPSAKADRPEIARFFDSLHFGTPDPGRLGPRGAGDIAYENEDGSPRERPTRPPVRIPDEPGLVGLLERSVEVNVPKDAAGHPLTGDVEAEIVVAVNGKVNEVRTSGGPEPLRRAVEAAVRQWTFRRFFFLEDNDSVRVAGTIRFRFGEPVDVTTWEIRGNVISLEKPGPSIGSTGASPGSIPGLPRSSSMSSPFESSIRYQSTWAIQPVRVRVTIDESGRVVAANAIEGPMDRRLKAEIAAQHSTFRPFVVNGRVVRVCGLIDF
jgi:hypothetical protein